MRIRVLVLAVVTPALLLASAACNERKQSPGGSGSAGDTSSVQGPASGTDTRPTTCTQNVDNVCSGPTVSTSHNEKSSS